MFGLPWPDLNEGIIYEDIVSLSSPEGQSACSLLEYYTLKYKDSAPKEGWLKRIQNGQVKINGTIVKLPDALVRSGNCLQYHRLPWAEPEAPWKLEVLYEDDFLLAINKPSGLQVLPGGLFQQRTVLTQLKWRCLESDPISTQQISSDRRFAQPSPVHRLGRGTSGVLLCAKSKAAKVKLSSDFAAGVSSQNCRRVGKRYRGLAMGIILEDKVHITEPIGTIPYPGVSKGLYVALPTGKPSESKVVVLARNFTDDCTLVEVEIFSGRPHQIRIHLSCIGHPLIGDPLYVAGGKPNTELKESNPVGCITNNEDGGYLRPANAVPGDCGYLLHAHKLMIFHPITEQLMEIIAPLPPNLCLPKEEATS